MTRIWVTRDEPPGGELAAALRRAGLVPVCEPVLERRLVADPTPFLVGLGPDDWLVLTSAFAAEAIPAQSVRCRVAVVGPSTRQAAARRGLHVAFECPEGTGEALWSTLLPRIKPSATICYPRSSLAHPPTIPAGLGVRLLAPILYETTPRDFDRSIVRRVDIVAVASPSAAEALADLRTHLPCASIGPTTSTALRRHHIQPWLEASPHTFVALAGAIAAKLTPPARPDASGPSPAPRR
jgi:uroporphyrinogen-III synthase